MGKKFRIGDIVMLLEDAPDENECLHKGDIGVVVKNYQFDPFVCVDWGKDVNGWDCFGSCPDGQGWACHESSLALAKEDEYEKFELPTSDELLEFFIA